MAPEQIRGKPCAASDQYALGVLAYEWMSGTLPFTGSLSELIAQHQFASPAPLQGKVPGLPSAVQQVVMKALAKEPNDRYPCVQGFADALEQVMQVSTVTSSFELPADVESFHEEDPTLPSPKPLIISTPDALAALAPTPPLSTPDVAPSPQPQTRPQL